MKSVPQHAIVLQHPRSPVVFDPREPPHPDAKADAASVIRSQAATITELQTAVRVLTRPPLSDEFQALETVEVLERLAARIGWKRVAIIARNLAHVNGEDIERPTNRCLADGAALINSICVQCGRDNS